MTEIRDAVWAGATQLMAARLLGCEWGRGVRTKDDPTSCGARAVQRVALHGPDGGVQLVQVCAHHLDVIETLTDPHATPP